MGWYQGKHKAFNAAANYEKFHNAAEAYSFIEAISM